MQGEKIAVLKFHRARIFIGHAEIGELRRRDDLHPWRDLLRAAKRLSDKRPAHVYRRRRDAAGFPAACSPVDRGFGEDILIAMIQVAAQIAGKGYFLTPGRDLPQVTLGPGDGALRVLSFASVDG